MSNDAQKNRILETGLEKFRRFGIRRVTMDEIARELRISKKTLYQHFPDKAALVCACVARIQGTVLPAVAAAIGGSGPAIERIIGTWRALATLPRHMSGELIADVQADYPELWREIDLRRHEVLGRFEALIAEGVRAGDIRPEVHPKVAMRIIFAIIDNVMIPDVLALGEFTPAEAVNTIIAMFAQGMCTAPPDRFLAAEVPR
jgi:AcrR family transcriptional regulator